MAGSMTGYLALVLTAHAPYLRSAGRRPDGEDALHELIATSLVPTINLLHDLRGLGLAPRVALAWSPILLEQLADSVVQKHFMLWMDTWLDRVAAELARAERAGEEHRSYLARFYLDWGQEILRSFAERYGRNLVAALRELCADDLIEPLVGPATHPYLPLIEEAASIRAQFDLGTLAVTRWLGQRPHGLWLPECGYHPRLEPHILDNELRYLIIDGSSVVPEGPLTLLRPRWATPQRLVALVHHEVAAERVGSLALGYVGDPLYRATQIDRQSGLACWRNGLDPAQPPELYDPYHAFRRAQEHAAHFRAYVNAELGCFQWNHDRPSLMVVTLDAALLGRDWFEGPAWLRAVLMELGVDPAVVLTTPTRYLREYPPRQCVVLREGSWGEEVNQLLHDSYRAVPLWAELRLAGQRLAALVQRHPNAASWRERVLAQATRELLLAQSSDWLLLNELGLDPSGASQPALHLRRCVQLCDLAEQSGLSEADDALLAQLEEEDNPFAYLNYRVFADGG